eukprot:15418757-Alexandrium_andersonii.AAC.1
MKELQASWRSEFSGLRDTMRVQINCAEDLAQGVGSRVQALEDGLAQLTLAVQGLKTQAGDQDGRTVYTGAPAPGG